jgi:hypothetical protein
LKLSIREFNSDLRYFSQATANSSVYSVSFFRLKGHHHYSTNRAFDSGNPMELRDPENEHPERAGNIAMAIELHTE